MALGGAPAAAADEQTILHLLDYVGVDYPEAVADGKVKNADEYKEMLEFTAQAAAQLKALPPNPRKDALVAAAESLAGARRGESRRRGGRRRRGRSCAGR